jgi:hypothetical protein
MFVFVFIFGKRFGLVAGAYFWRPPVELLGFHFVRNANVDLDCSGTVYYLNWH